MNYMLNVIYFEKIDSTNLYAKQNMQNLQDRDIICADEQTQGRGRFNRPWADLGAENIYLTMVLKPSSQFSEVFSNLTQYLSLCICQELETLGLKPQIKWPNDVLINGKKVAGILAESVIKNGKLEGIALGMGINLKASRLDMAHLERPITSINLEYWGEIDKETFQSRILERFFENYETFLDNGFLHIKAEYEKRAIFWKDTIKLAQFDRVKEGEFKGFDNSGALLLRDSLNETHKITMGEIL